MYMIKDRLTPCFSDSILKLLNQRKLETLKERWWNQNPRKAVCEDDDDSGGGISIYNIGGVFIVIFVGIGLAIVTLIIEYWYYKYKKPAMRVDSASDKKMQVKQAAAAFGDKESQFQTEYRFDNLEQYTLNYAQFINCIYRLPT